MPQLTPKTLGGADPTGKPRVYFTCHPLDFDLFFEPICKDLFAAHDCAVYYTEDMEAEFSEEEQESDLNRMNLFVLPVTRRLLTSPCRAMQSDAVFAREKNIPILPILMEEIPESLYSLPENFGDAQYISPYFNDSSALRYSEKLKKRLEAVFTDDETEKRVREAFDAYIFLSYRKADRTYANELMRRLHAHPACWDVAVWYDEFLTPGESFRKNITAAMEKSSFVTLLVTPTVLAPQESGEANFVVREEYPEAVRMGKRVFPVEMQKTDRAQLASTFPGLPECTDPEDAERFYEDLARMLDGIRSPENDSDPEHKFLMGVAYLYGIDVETDRERGVALIKEAAEEGEVSALIMMQRLYSEGIGVPFDLVEALKYTKRIHESALAEMQDTDGNDPDVLSFFSSLSYAYFESGDYVTALALCEENYKRYRKSLGNGHPETVRVLSHLALVTLKQGNIKKAIALLEKADVLCRKTKGLDRGVYSAVLSNLGAAYLAAGKTKEALETQEKAFALSLKYQGEEHPDTLLELTNLAEAYLVQAEYEKAHSLAAASYNSLRKALGDKHPTTLRSATILCSAYSALGRYEEALTLAQDTYGLLVGCLGREHSDTLLTGVSLAQALQSTGRHNEALSLIGELYPLCLASLGERNPTTLTCSLTKVLSHIALQKDVEQAYADAKQTYTVCREILGDTGVLTANALLVFAQACCAAKRNEEALAWSEQAYTALRKLYGDENGSTLSAMRNLATAYCRNGYYEKSIALAERLQVLYRKVFGVSHPNTILIQNQLGAIYSESGRHKKALPLLENAYTCYVAAMGEKHPNSLQLLINLADANNEAGNREVAHDLYKKALTLALEHQGETEIYTVLHTYSSFFDGFRDLPGIMLRYRRLFPPRPNTPLREKASKIDKALMQAVSYCIKNRDLHTALKWQEKLLALRFFLLGSQDETLQLTFPPLIKLLEATGDGARAKDMQARLSSHISRLTEQEIYADAVFLQSFLFRINCRLLGNEHVESIEALEKLAHIFYAEKGYRAALNRMNTVLLRYTSIFGEEDERTQAARRFIQELRSLLGI